MNFKKIIIDLQDDLRLVNGLEPPDNRRYSLKKDLNNRLTFSVNFFSCKTGQLII